MTTWRYHCDNCHNQPALDYPEIKLCFFCSVAKETGAEPVRPLQAQRVCPPGHYIVWDALGAISYRCRSALDQRKQPYPKINLDKATINDVLDHAVGNRLSAACDKWLKAIGKIEKQSGRKVTTKPATEATRPQPVEPDRASFRCYEVRTNAEDEYVGTVTCDLCMVDEVEIALRAWGYKVVRQ